MVMATAKFTHETCREQGEPEAMCDYMEQYSKEYEHHDEYLIRRERLEKASVLGEGFGLTSRSDILPHERKLNSMFNGHKNNRLKHNKQR